MIIEYLQNNKFPTYFDDKQKHRLTFKAMPCTIITDSLYKRGKDNVLLEKTISMWYYINEKKNSITI